MTAPRTQKKIDEILRKKGVSLLLHYEPYDGIPVDQDHLPPKFTPGGARFQKSFHMSKVRTRLIISATKVGKSIATGVQLVTMMTGVIPYSMRVEDGYDTRIKRALPSDHPRLGMSNVQRWGRRDVKTGRLLDYCWHDQDLRLGEVLPKGKYIEEDGTWDCGTIIGVGEFPRNQICTQEYQQAWICVYKQIRDTRWRTMMDELLPRDCLDLSKGTEGFSTKEQTYFLKDGSKTIRYITYEQSFERVEGAEDIHCGVMDEEPLSREFYTSLNAHALWLLIGFTPLHGAGLWTYDDLYMPAKEGTHPDMDLFHCTVYDCPVYDQRKLRSLEHDLAPHEKDAKLLGIFSKRDGRPYFPYEICKRYLDDFRPSHSCLATIAPQIEVETVDNVVKTPMVLTAVESPGNASWEIYEDRQDKFAYWASIDCGEGSDDPEEVQDMSICHIWRKPDTDERREEDQNDPVMVAALYSGDPCVTFAWLVLYGCCYYNRCLMAPESKGDQGKSFVTELRNYPHILQMTVTNDRTRKPKTNLGFDTNAGTRTSSINKIRKWINKHDQDPKLPHLQLLKEMLTMIWLRGRPDHPNAGKSDCIISFAICLWVWEEEQGQIQNNRPLRAAKKNERIWSLFPDPTPKKRVLGRRTLGSRRRNRPC